MVATGGKFWGGGKVVYGWGNSIREFCEGSYDSCQCAKQQVSACKEGLSIGLFPPKQKRRRTVSFFAWNILFNVTRLNQPAPVIFYECANRRTIMRSRTPCSASAMLLNNCCFCESFINQARSKRSRFITLFHAATKSCRNFSRESSLP